MYIVQKEDFADGALVGLEINKEIVYFNGQEDRFQCTKMLVMIQKAEAAKYRDPTNGLVKRKKCGNKQLLYDI